jgi:hypothetical protein
MMDYKEAVFKGNVFVEEVFCGRARSQIIDIGRRAELSDFKLVHKADEEGILRRVEEFLANPENHKSVIRPTTAPLPPIWKELIAREQNISPEDVPEIPLVFRDFDPEIRRPTRPAKDGEEPHFKIGPSHAKPLHEEFYEHVIFNREAAREKYCSGPVPDPDFIYANKVLPPLNLEKKPKQSSHASK